MSSVLDTPLNKLTAYELVQNVEHGCYKIPASVTLGELGWPQGNKEERCGFCRSCTALAILDQALKESRGKRKIR